MERQLREVYHILKVIVTEEVNYLMSNEPQVLHSLRNQYLIVIIVNLIIDFYLKLLITNNYYISEIITLCFAYYINFKHLSKLLAIILNDLCEKFAVYFDVFQLSSQLIYDLSLKVTLLINYIVLYSIKVGLTDIIINPYKHWSDVDVYLMIAWMLTQNN